MEGVWSVLGTSRVGVGAAGIYIYRHPVFVEHNRFHFNSPTPPRFPRCRPPLPPYVRN